MVNNIIYSRNYTLHLESGLQTLWVDQRGSEAVAVQSDLIVELR
jgi:hypothetical protein